MAAKIATKLSQACIDVLTRATITATTVTLPEQLARPLYVEVNKALNSAGGKWNKRRGLHEFPADPRAALGLTVETGTAINHRIVKQAFYTPAELATRVAKAASLRDCAGESLLEPSCGHGALILAALEQQRELVIVAYDNDGDAIEKVIEIPDVARASCQDFLKVAPPTRPHYTRVLMNPPFRNGADIEHVTHASKFLAPGGLLVAIMWPGWRTARTKKAVAFRALIEKYHHTVEEIEAGAFAESGTQIATVMLKLWNVPKGLRGSVP